MTQARSLDRKSLFRILANLVFSHIGSYIPIVDSAIYRPNPANITDAYATYDRGNTSNVFLRNPDASEVSSRYLFVNIQANSPQYIGAVWPGYTGTFQIFNVLTIHFRSWSFSIPRLALRSGRALVGQRNALLV
jgi:hypothetical protein